MQKYTKLQLKLLEETFLKEVSDEWQKTKMDLTRRGLSFGSVYYESLIRVSKDHINNYCNKIIEFEKIALSKNPPENPNQYFVKLKNEIIELVSPKFENITSQIQSMGPNNERIKTRYLQEVQSSLNQAQGLIGSNIDILKEELSLAGFLEPNSLKKTGGKMKIFWSWQNDVSPKTCRHFIREALKEAIEVAGLELGERPEIDHATKDMAGMVDIADAIFEKIAASSIFVPDITPIGKSHEGKALPNPNVCIELGWAINKPGWGKIIAIINIAEGSIEELPFDLRGRRILSYNLKRDADKKERSEEKIKLVMKLKEAIKTNLADAVQEKSTSIEISGVTPNPNNPSIWNSYKSPLEHREFSASIVSINILDTPRGYLRLIPEGWTETIPKVKTISKLDSGERIEPVMQGGSSGSFGEVADGYVNYWFAARPDGSARQVKNICYYFEPTGEFWVLHGTAIDNKFLSYGSLIKHWSITMRKVLALFDNPD